MSIIRYQEPVSQTESIKQKHLLFISSRQTKLVCRVAQVIHDNFIILELYGLLPRLDYVARGPVFFTVLANN